MIAMAVLAPIIILVLLMALQRLEAALLPDGCATRSWSHGFSVPGEVRTVPKPCDREQSLNPAGQRPGSLPGAAGFAFGAQQAGDEPDQLTGDVEHGRIGDIGQWRKRR
jgi:hypothetical protein